jgi:hypothetical protein
LTATAYSAGPPASSVVQAGETYVCLISHTSGVFATDLAASKWIKVAQKGTGDLLASNNLSDLANAATARTNLSVPGLATTNAFSNTTEATGVGTTASGIFAGGVEILKKLFVAGIAHFTNSTASTSTTTGAVVVTGGLGVAKDINVGGAIRAAQGTNFATNDGGIQFYSGVDWKVQFDVTGGGTVPTFVIRYNVDTAAATHGHLFSGGAAASPTNLFQITGGGALSYVPIGYTTGAGGTVTQATNKATGVTLDKASGQITMNNAALAAGAIVSFFLSNSSIRATDTLIINHISGGTPGSYSFNAQCINGGTTINVRNNTAGSLSEAIVLQFNLVKGATS